MASRSSARIRDKDKAVRGLVGGGGSDSAEGLVRSSGRASRHSNRSKPEPQSIVFNFNGDVQITKGAMFGRSPDEELQQLPRSRPALPTGRGRQAYGETTALRIHRPHRIDAIEDECAEEESDEFESGRNYSCEDLPSQRPLASRPPPTSTARVRTWRRDSGYGGSTRGSKREKNEVYRASMSKGLSDGSLPEQDSSHTKRKTKQPIVESDVDGGTASGDAETPLATQGGDGGDNADDSDDDFEHRVMQVAGAGNKAVDVRVILDTGTKPDWISSRFLTETLGLKYTRFNSEEIRQEFSDFNGNKFTGIGRAELMVTCRDFAGFSCRKITFLVAQGGTFRILLGSSTIKGENLLCKPPEAPSKGAFPAVQTDLKKAERTVIVQNKEKQEREGAGRDKMREEVRKAKTKERKESKSSSSSSAARLAQESKPRRRREKSTSAPTPPPRNAKYPESKGPTMSSWKKTKAPVHERSSSSSSSAGGGAAIDG